MSRQQDPQLVPGKKQWTPRARTGCNTCRSRHVKCDEKKPVCTQCNIARRECTGYSYGNRIGGDTGYPILIMTHTNPSKGLDPVDWNLQEACQYYVEVQVPMNNHAEFGPDSLQPKYDAKAELRRGGIEPWSFKAMVLQHRIICGSVSVRARPVFGSVHGMNHIWYMLYECIGMTVKNLNEYIQAGMRPSWILYQTINMLGIELGILMPTWRLHAKGMAALIKGYGGMENLQTMKIGAFSWVQYGFVASTACNTTSPPSDQIVGVTDWSRNEVRLAYSHSGRETFPCPTELFFELIEVTRLRAAAYTGKLSRTHLLRNARKIAKAVRDFDPDTWTETYNTEGPTFTLKARLFKSAITLYAILSLPPRLTKPFAVPQPTLPGSATNTDAQGISHREYYRDQLFQLFTESWNTLLRESLAWPAAVLGVAVADSPIQRRQVMAWLDYLRWMPSTDGGTHALISILEEFWVSGRVKWDDCFYEPISVLL